MSFTLPHDLDKVPEHKLEVAMLDDNFDTIQAWARDIEGRFVGLFKQVDGLIKENTRLANLVQQRVDSRAEAARTAPHAASIKATKPRAVAKIRRGK